MTSFRRSDTDPDYLADEYDSLTQPVPRRRAGPMPVRQAGPAIRAAHRARGRWRGRAAARPGKHRRRIHKMDHISVSPVATG